MNPSRHHAKRRRPHDRKSKLSKRTVLALIDRFLDNDETTGSSSSESDYQSDAENMRPTNRSRRRDRLSDLSPHPRKKRRHRDPNGVRPHPEDEVENSNPAWAQPDAIRALGQNIAEVVGDAAPTLLEKPNVLRKLEVGLAKVVATFAIKYGIGDHRGLVEGENGTVDQDSEDELDTQRPHRHAGARSDGNIWDAPPLPARTVPSSTSKPYARSSHRRDISLSSHEGPDADASSARRKNDDAWSVRPVHRTYTRNGRDQAPLSRPAPRQSLPNQLQMTPRPESNTRPSPATLPRTASLVSQSRGTPIRQQSPLPRPLASDRHSHGNPRPSRLRISNSQSPGSLGAATPDALPENTEEIYAKFNLHSRPETEEEGFADDTRAVPPTNGSSSRPNKPFNQGYVRDRGTNWIVDDDALLLDMRARDVSWDGIAEQFYPRSVLAVQRRWQKLSQLGIHTGMEARAAAFAAPAGNVTVRARVSDAARLREATAGQVEQWSPADKATLLRLHGRGTPWPELDASFPGRSHNSIKAMLYRLKRLGAATAAAEAVAREGFDEVAEGEGLEGSVAPGDREDEGDDSEGEGIDNIDSELQ